MGVIVACVKQLGLGMWPTLLIQVPLGAAIYIRGSKLLRMDSFEYVLSMVKDFLSKQKKSDA